MRWLVTGASGKLGGYVMKELSAQRGTTIGWCGSRGADMFGRVLQPVDLANEDRIVTAYRQARPDVIIHAGAMAAVGDCFRDPQRALAVNVRATEVLLELAETCGARLLFTSTDLVFDGELAPYREQDPATPLSVYGRSKLAAEELVLKAGQVALRLSLLYGPAILPGPSYFTETIDALRNGKPVALFEDEWRTPLSLRTAAQSLVRLAQSDFTGLLHLGGPERLSRLEMGQRLASYLKLEGSSIRVVKRCDVAAAEPRPRDVSLDSSEWRRRFPDQAWPSWHESLEELSI